jgi:hypothetical protein
MNSNLIAEETRQSIDFRIIGRQAWKKGVDDTMKKPKMSWSVPFKWFWTMPKRLHKELMEPSPLQLPKENIEVLEGFTEG